MSFSIFHSAVFFIAIAIFAIVLFSLVFRFISMAVGSKQHKNKNRQPKRTHTRNFIHFNQSHDDFMRQTEMMNDFTRQETERQFNSFMQHSVAENQHFMDSVNNMNEMNTINSINEMNNMMNMNPFM